MILEFKKCFYMSNIDIWIYKEVLYKFVKGLYIYSVICGKIWYDIYVNEMLYYY